jgi:hypothetical protein
VRPFRPSVPPISGKSVSSRGGQKLALIVTISLRPLVPLGSRTEIVATTTTTFNFLSFT